MHPIIKYFEKNTAFSDGIYQVLEEQRSVHRRAPEIQFEDVVGLAKFWLHININ